jgi:hypothetical protein
MLCNTTMMMNNFNDDVCMLHSNATDFIESNNSNYKFFGLLIQYLKTQSNIHFNLLKKFEITTEVIIIFSIVYILMLTRYVYILKYNILLANNEKIISIVIEDRREKYIKDLLSKYKASQRSNMELKKQNTNLKLCINMLEEKHNQILQNGNIRRSVRIRNQKK